jgi:hypothetical protein
MEELRDTLEEFIKRVTLLFLRTLFMWLAWQVVAPHLNAYVFGYWEMMLIQLGLLQLGATLFKKG